MSFSAVFSILLTGAIAGWLASVVLKVRGLGLASYTVVGIIGAAVGHWVMGVLGLSLGGDLLHNIASAFIGAMMVLLLVSALKR